MASVTAICVCSIFSPNMCKNLVRLPSGGPSSMMSLIFVVKPIERNWFNDGTRDNAMYVAIHLSLFFFKRWWRLSPRGGGRAFWGKGDEAVFRYSGLIWFYCVWLIFCAFHWFRVVFIDCITFSIIFLGCDWFVDVHSFLWILLNLGCLRGWVGSRRCRLPK